MKHWPAAAREWRPDMVRWIIWAQVGFALIGFLATWVDQGNASSWLIPPEFLISLVAFSAFVCPMVVILLGRRREPGSGEAVETIASIALGAVTLFAMVPLVQ